MGMNEIRKYFSKIGKKGGSAKTERKIHASRINGCKGGRPRTRTETRAEYQKRWKIKNREKVKEIDKRAYLKWRKISPWLKHYKYARTRGTNKKSKYYQRGIRFNMTRADFKELWFRDQAWKLESPSIDRIKNSIGYEKSNCQFIERRINSGKRG